MWPAYRGFRIGFYKSIGCLMHENCAPFAGPAELLRLMRSYPLLQILKGFGMTLQDMKTAVHLKKISIPVHHQSLIWLNYSQLSVETTISLPLPNKPVSSTCPEQYEFRKLFHIQRVSKKKWGLDIYPIYS